MCVSCVRMEGISWSVTMCTGISQCAGRARGFITVIVCLLRSPWETRIGNALAIIVIFVVTPGCGICVSTALWVHAQRVANQEVARSVTLLIPLSSTSSGHALTAYHLSVQHLITVRDALSLITVQDVLTLLIVFYVPFSTIHPGNYPFKRFGRPCTIYGSHHCNNMWQLSINDSQMQSGKGKSRHNIISRGNSYYNCI